MAKLIISILVAFALISWLSGLFSGDGGTQAAVLTAPMSASDVVVNVDSTEGFQSSGYAMIQNETVTFTGKTATSFTGLSRGIENTVATGHPLVSNGLRVKFYTEDAGGLNKAMGFDAGAIMASNGIVGIPVILWDFFAITLPMVISWDNLSWMTGQLAYIRTILIIVSAGLTIALALIGLNNLISAKR